MNTASMPMTLSPLALFSISEESPGCCHLMKWKQDLFALPHKPSLKFGRSSLCYLYLIQAEAWRNIKLKTQLEAEMEQISVWQGIRNGFRIDGFYRQEINVLKEKLANKGKECEVQGECWDKRQAHKRMKMTEEVHMKIY